MADGTVDGSGETLTVLVQVDQAMAALATLAQEAHLVATALVAMVTPMTPQGKETQTNRQELARIRPLVAVGQLLVEQVKEALTARQGPTIQSLVEVGQM